jgi:hypothetical protein
LYAQITYQKYSKAYYSHKSAKYSYLPCGTLSYIQNEN